MLKKRFYLLSTVLIWGILVVIKSRCTEVFNPQNLIYLVPVESGYREQRESEAET